MFCCNWRWKVWRKESTERRDRENITNPLIRPVSVRTGAKLRQDGTFVQAEVAVQASSVGPRRWPWGRLALLLLYLAVLGLVGTLAWGLAAARRLEEFHSLKLTSGGSLVSGLQGAMFGLDLGLMRDILVDRKALEAMQAARVAAE